MKKDFARYPALLAGVLAVALIASPLSGFAKEKEERKENGKAFGHLVAPGWIKKNGTSTVSIGSWLPYGIAKRLGLAGTSTATTTVDVTAPVIASIASYPQQTKAKLAWTTDERSDSAVYYATSSAALDTISTSTANVAKKGLVKEHEVVVSGLSASTTYYFKVGSKDKAGNASLSPVMTFTTKPADVVVTYPSISNVSVVSGTSTIRVAWKTNEPATSKVYYGTSTVDTNATTTSFVLDSALVTDHSVTVSGLATSTAHNLVIESKNAAGNASFSNSLSATTGI